MKLKLIAGIVLLSSLNLFAMEKATESYKELVKSEVINLNKKIVPQINKELYVKKIEFIDDKVIYTYVANLRKFARYGDNVIPWEKDNEETYHSIKTNLKVTLSAIAVRNFKTNICFNNSTRYILQHGVPIQMNLELTENSESIRKALITEESCKKYDQFRKK